MSQQDQQNPTSAQPARVSGFNFVDVVGDDWKGHINLFWGDQPLALVPPPMATAIRSEIIAQSSTVPASDERRAAQSDEAMTIANLTRLLRRVTSELEDLNGSIRSEIDEDMADPDGEREMCDATDELIQEAQLYLASLPADA